MALYRLAYARVSSQDQNIELQIGQFESLGYDELFQERVSGRKRDRPEFAKLTERALELREHRHDVHVLVIEWSRWARDTAFALDTLKRLEDAGVLVIETTTGQPLTLMTADGFISTSMKSVMAHYYSIELSGRSRRAYDARKLKHRPTSNRPIWGYQHSTDKSHWVPSKDWQICRESVEHFMNGEPINGICRWLAEQGTRKSRHGLIAWLKHPAIRGHSKHREEIFYNTHEPLITESEWQQIKRQLEQNRRLRGRNKGRIYPVPSNLCRCQDCGRSLAVKVSTHGRYFYCYYRCSLRDGSCNAPRKYCRDLWVEAAIQEAIADAAEAVADVLSEGGKDTVNPAVAEKERELTQLRKLAHVPGVADAIEGLKLEIEQLKTAADRDTVTGAERMELIQALAMMKQEQWAAMSAEERRDVYSQLVARVDVLGADVVRVVLR
ncbi:MAG: recombinase family protein [Leptolyngbya sp. SIOISBB]|nr:recombinase family protein [Leptolyngbya sp. SIOISBB]